MMLLLSSKILAAATCVAMSTAFAFQPIASKVPTSRQVFRPSSVMPKAQPLLLSDRQIGAFSRYPKALMATTTADTSGDDTPQSKAGFLEKIKAALPPKDERQKLIPLATMFFCILFNYTILRDTKDVLMVTAPKSGAEVIPFIKTYVNLPAAIGFTGIYAGMCDRMDQKSVFYSCVIPFLAFFLSFALFIYPNRGLLHPHGLVDMLASKLPAGFSAPLSIFRNWSFAVFYVMAEMWGSVVASLIFWSTANNTMTVDEAKKNITRCLDCLQTLRSSFLGNTFDGCQRCVGHLRRVWTLGRFRYATSWERLLDPVLSWRLRTSIWTKK